MARRIQVPEVRPGEIHLGTREAHHARDVLRLKQGTAVEVFDDAGHIGAAVLGRLTAQEVSVIVDSVAAAKTQEFRFIIASAVPKGTRGDWMVEKLSELGTTAFVPLATDRSVVLPEGKSKRARWQRLAGEAARQSRRDGVMRIDPLTPLQQAVENALAVGEAWHLSTLSDAFPMRQRLSDLRAKLLTMFIGPEGGWSLAESELFARRQIPAVGLTQTILRVETAALTAAAVIATMLCAASDSPENKP